MAAEKNDAYSNTLAENVSCDFCPEEIVELSEKEKDFLILLTYVESGNQKEDGQVAVAAVILNRLESSDFPNSIEKIAFQKSQFSSTRNGKFYIGNEVVAIDQVPEKTRRAVKRALLGEDPTEETLKETAERLGLDTEKYASGGALYFYNPKCCNKTALQNRAKIKANMSIGAHVFYKYWDN